MGLPDGPELALQRLDPIKELLDNPVARLLGLREGVVRCLGSNGLWPCQARGGEEHQTCDDSHYRGVAPLDREEMSQQAGGLLGRGRRNLDGLPGRRREVNKFPGWTTELDGRVVILQDEY